MEEKGAKMRSGETFLPAKHAKKICHCEERSDEAT